MITIESKGKDIILFGRDANNIAYVQKIEDFYPYFYVEDENGEFNTIDGKKAKKIECKDPKEVRELRDNYKKTYEADIRFVNRYIIDRVQEIPKEKVRLCYLDIESQKTEKGYEDPFLGVNPILSIVVYDNFLEEYKAFCVGETHSTERQMLIEFSKYIQERNPDMFVAWNGDGYDFPMLVNRLRYLKLNPDALCRSGGKAYSKDEDTHIYGRICFDLMKGYKKIAQGGRENWSLDYISKYEGMGGKEVYTGDLDDLYKTDIKKFMSYNKRDVELMVLIDGKLNIISFFDEMRRLCFSRFEDVFMSSKLADCLCLKFAQNKYVLPSGNKSEETDKYPGAFVHASEPKLHRNVAVMDFKSLYPSIMIGFNTSYETIIPEKTENCINAFDKFYYKKEQGIIPAIVAPMLKARADTRKEMKKFERKSQEYKSLDMKQFALKVCANAFYGVLGFKNYRLYNKDVATSITFIAQNIIHETMKWFENKGFSVVYGDTDSLFITNEKLTIEQIVELNKEYNVYLKTYFKKFGVPDERNIFELQFEKVYKTIFFKRKADGTGAKKKYAGNIIWKDGNYVDEFNLMGFESKRSDSPQCGRDLLSNVLKLIVYEKSKEEIDEYIKSFKEKIRTEIPCEDIGFPVGFSKPLEEYGNPIHVKAARYSNLKHNASIKKGDKIKYIFVIHEETPVVAFKNGKNMWEGYKIDYSKMIKRIVDMKIQPLYKGLGWAYECEPQAEKKKKEPSEKTKKRRVADKKEYDKQIKQMKLSSW